MSVLDPQVLTALGVLIGAIAALIETLRRLFRRSDGPSRG